VTRRLVVLLLPIAVATGLLVAAYGRAREPGPGEARLAVDGTAVVVRADGYREEVDTVTLLHRGDRVTVVDGTGWLDLAGDTRLAARSASGGSPDSSLRMDRVPTLFAGDLLVEAGDPLTVDTGTASVDVAESAAHLRRSYATAVAVYSGEAGITTAGRELAVPGLREAQVSAPGRLPTRPRPLHYDGADEWDRRFLGEAMALGEELSERARAYTATLGPDEGDTPGFFELLLPQLDDEPAFGADLVEDDRSPAETLIGAAITVLGEDDPFTTRWHEVFGFRDQGAAWGLVALDQRVDANPLRGTVERALNATRYEFGTPLGIVARLGVVGGAGLDGRTGAAALAAGGPGGIGTVGGPDGSGPDGSGPGGTGPDGSGPDGTEPGGGPGSTEPGGGPTTTDPGGGGTTLPTVTIPPTTVTTTGGGGGGGGGGDDGIDDAIDDFVDTVTSIVDPVIPPGGGGGGLPTTVPPLPITTTTVRLPTTTVPPPTLPRPTTTTTRLPTTLPPTTLPPLPTSTTIRPPLP
jgi:hypothetical protein